MAQKAKVIRKKDQSLFGGRKWPWAVGAFALLLLFAMAMPMADIPGFSRLAAILGVSPEAFRTLTLTDLAAYGAGISGNRVAAAQYAGAYGGYSQYDYRGGLSAVSMPGGNRLLDAREAYRREYELTGKYPPGVMGPLSMGQYPGQNNYYDGVAMAGAGNVPIIDGERVGPGGEYGPGYGSPIADGAMAGIGSAAGPGSAAGEGKPVLKPVNPYDIVGAGHNVSIAGQALSKAADGFKMGRLGGMGGFNALASRVNPNIGSMGQYGAFGDVGRSYFYSYSGVMTGYKTTAKQLAEAAFDGNEMEAETMVLPDEKEEMPIGSLSPPSTILNRINASNDACKKAQESYEKQVVQMGKDLKGMKLKMQSAGSISNKGIPGNCTKFLGAATYAARGQWNGLLDSMIEICKSYKDGMASYSGTCGISYNPTPKGKECGHLEKFRARQKSSFSNFWDFKRCKNDSQDSAGQTIRYSDFEQMYKDVMTDEFPGAAANFI